MLAPIIAAAGGRADVRMGEPMRGHTSLGIGGPAEAYVLPEDTAAMAAVVREAHRAGVPVLAVGGGTNLLAPDDGIAGVVIAATCQRGMEIVKEEGDSVLVRVGAGAALARLVAFAAERGLVGIEGLAGIPGRVGGAIAGNAGAYGAEMGGVTRNVSVLMPDGTTAALAAAELSFAYRTAHLPEGAIVLSAEVALVRGDRNDVARRTREALAAKRATQPLDERSAGCVFKNPAGEAAGALIDRAGCKGMRRGDIEVSARHANFFVNRGVGTAGDFLALMERVAGRVRDVFGIGLEPEIRVVGG